MSHLYGALIPLTRHAKIDLVFNVIVVLNTLIRLMVLQEILALMVWFEGKMRIGSTTQRGLCTQFCDLSVELLILKAFFSEFLPCRYFYAISVDEYVSRKIRQ